MATFEFADTATPSIDWYATMRDCVGEASVLADRVAVTDSEAGEALQRLCNVVAHLLDENKALSGRVDVLERMREDDYVYWPLNRLRFE
jgi:hypothetical protein